MSDIERAYDLEAVVAAHRAATITRGSWRRLSDMEYDAIAGTVLRQRREGAVSALDKIAADLLDADTSTFGPCLAPIIEDVRALARRIGGQ